MTYTKLKSLDKSIQRTKKLLYELGDIRPGSLKQQMRMAKEAYGSYWHLSYTHLGKGHTEYIRREALEQIKKEVANYRRFKTLVDRLITLSIERSKLKMQLGKGASK